MKLHYFLAKGVQSIPKKYLQCSCSGWPTGNGKKLSSSQACYLAQLCLATASFLSISCGPSWARALYTIYQCSSGRFEIWRVVGMAAKEGHFTGVRLNNGREALYWCARAERFLLCIMKIWDDQFSKIPRMRILLLDQIQQIIWTVQFKFALAIHISPTWHVPFTL